jgi:hypothetical protein
MLTSPCSSTTTTWRSRSFALRKRPSKPSGETMIACVAVRDSTRKPSSTRASRNGVSASFLPSCARRRLPLLATRSLLHPSPSSSSPPVFLCRAVRQPPWASVSASSLPLVLHLPVLWGNKTRVVYASARLQRFGRRERNCSIRALFFGSRAAFSTCATRRFPAGLCANLMARPIRDATRSSLGLATAACPKISLAGSSARQSRTRTWRGRAAKRCARRWCAHPLDLSGESRQVRTSEP